MPDPSPSIDPPAPGEQPRTLRGKVAHYLFRNTPALLWAPQTRQLCAKDVSDLKAEFPLPQWTFAPRQPSGGTLPQVIGHRGDKAGEPENSMRAFRSCVAAGAQAIETDVHVTRDGVVVLSHDGNLKRCFGRDANIIDLDWADIQPLRSTRPPHEPMPTLAELLQYLAEPGLEAIWTLLDIKIDVDPQIIMSLLAKTIAAVDPAPHRPWNQRILLGVWGSTYLPLARQLLPDFSVTNIGFSTLYARSFFQHPYVSFNMLALIVVLWPVGPRFIRAAHARSRSVILWTVNDERMMRWAIGQGVDGVITDDPRRLLEVLDEWRAGRRDASLPLRAHAMAVWFNGLALFFTVLLMHWRYRDRFDGGKARRASWRYKQLSGPDAAQAPRLT